VASVAAFTALGTQRTPGDVAAQVWLSSWQVLGTPPGSGGHGSVLAPPQE
jgi:hypothetical protein